MVFNRLSGLLCLQKKAEDLKDFKLIGNPFFFFYKRLKDLLFNRIADNFLPHGNLPGDIFKAYQPEGTP